MVREEGASQNIAVLTVGPHSFIPSQCIVTRYSMGVTQYRQVA